MKRTGVWRFAACLPVFVAWCSTGSCGVGGGSPLPVAEFMKIDLAEKAEGEHRISADGKWVAFREMTREGNRLLTRRLGGEKTFDIGASPGIPGPVGNFAWARVREEERLLCLVPGPDGSETILLARPDGSAVEDVTPKSRPVRLVGALRQDPGRVLVEAGERGVCRLDLATGALETTLADPGECRHFFPDHAGEVRVAATDGGKIFYRKGSKDPLREITLKKEGESVVPIFRFTPDNARFYAFSNRGRDRIALVTVDPETGREELVHEHPFLDYIFDTPVFSHKKRKIVGITLASGPEAFFFDDDWKRIHAPVARELPGDAIEYLDADRSEENLLVGARSAVRGGSVYHLDVKAGKLTLLARRSAWPDGSPCPETRRVSFAAGDGMLLHGRLFMPAGRKPGEKLPAIVMAHEIPWRESPLKQFTAGNFHFLADRGYAVLYVDHRGSAGYGRAFREAATGGLAGRILEDYADAARWLAKEGIADPKRIGIYGQDWGGFVAAWMPATRPDLFACGFSVKGGLDLAGMIPRFSAFYGEMLPHEAAEAEAYLKGGANLSLPGLDKARVKNPLFFMTIDAMNIFADAEATRKFVKEVNDAGGTAYHVDVEGALYTPENMTLYMRALDAFFARHLGGRQAKADADSGGPLLEAARKAAPATAAEMERTVLEYWRGFPDMAECFDAMFGRFVQAHTMGARPDGLTDREWERLFQLRALPEASFARIYEEAVRRLKVEGSGYLGVFPGAARDGIPAVVLDGVAEGGPAEKGGLKAGDRVTEANGKAVASPDDLLGVLSGLKAGDTVSLALLRKSEEGPCERLTVAVVLEKRPAPAVGDPLGAALRRVPLVPARPLALTGKSPPDEALRRAVEKGTAYILSRRGADGLWAYQAKSQVDPAELTQEFSLINVGAVQVECTPWLMTSLAGMALRASIAVDPSRHAEMEPLVAKSLDFVSQAPQGEIPGGVYRHLVLDFLCAEYRFARDEALRTRIRDRAAEVSRALLRHRFPGKGWGYDLGSLKPSASFITAPVLLSLDRATAAGIAIPAEAVREASDALWKMRAKGMPKGERGWYPGEEGREWYIYVEGNEADVSSRLRGGAGRIPMCDLALLRLGRRSQADLARSLATFLEVRDELDTHWGYRGIHAGPYANASYYILYDYWYAAMAASALEDAALRARVRAAIQEALLMLQAEDGTWCDHPAFGKLYGTAMALMALGETVD